jgi:hypothetical protein
LDLETQLLMSAATREHIEQQWHALPQRGRYCLSRLISVAAMTWTAKVGIDRVSDATRAENERAARKNADIWAGFLP